MAVRNSADNDVEWVRKVSRASGDLVNVLPDERERERERERNSRTKALGGA